MKPAPGKIESKNQVELIADAVLYEGYILYPYRPSAVKNQQRWNFGALCPEAYALAQGGTENSTMETQCLVVARSETTINVKVRFLHLLLREVLAPIHECKRSVAECEHFVEQGSSVHYRAVPVLNCNGKLLQTWQEALEREVLIRNIRLKDLRAPAKVSAFSFPDSRQVEAIPDTSTGETVGLVVRSQYGIDGAIRISAVGAEIGSDETALLRLSVEIENNSLLANAETRSRDDALLRSFVSTHTILSVKDGEFISLLDPPDFARLAAKECINKGTYPVLAGPEGQREWLLSSPIILYDYPQIAPESAGDLCDGTEIDEILTLRIMTLTEDEKQEIRGSDDRARAILERTENLPPEQLMKLHGAMKSVKRNDIDG